MEQMSEEEEKAEKKAAAAKSGRRIGIIGYGHLGQFLKMELLKSEEFSLVKIWNRSEDLGEEVLPLEELKAANLADVDLVIEVAHPEVVHQHAKTILAHADLFIGSSTALADPKTYKEIQNCLRLHPSRSVFVPCGALWGAKDIQKMADLGILKALTITMMLHPGALRLPQLGTESTPELAVMHKFCEEAKRSNQPKVLYNGPVRQLCPLAPHNVNTMAGAAIAAHSLGFDNTRARLIVDPQLSNWQIVEFECLGENGYRSVVRRENPAKPGVVAGESSYFSFLSSVRETLYKPPGFNIC